MNRLTHYDKGNRIAGLLILLCCIISCATNKKTTEQKVYEARQKHIALLQEARELYPCDSSTVYLTKTDTAYITLAPDTVVKNGIQYITKDRIITNTAIKQVTVVDRASEQQKRDSIDNLIYNMGVTQTAFNKYIKDTDISTASLQAEIKALKKYRSIIYWIAGIMSLGGLFFALRALKLINI